MPGTCGYPINVYNPTNWHKQAGNEPVLAGPQVACLPRTGGAWRAGVGPLGQELGEGQERFCCTPGKWSNQSSRKWTMPTIIPSKFRPYLLHLEMILETPGLVGTVSLVHADSIKPGEISSGSLRPPEMASKSACKNTLPFNSFLERLALVWPRDHQ